MRNTSGTFPSGLPSWIACLALLLSLAAPASARALFDDTAELKIELEFPLQELLWSKRSRREFSGILRYAGASGEPVALAVGVRARGKTRLQLCDLPPLRLDFKRKQLEGTLFEGQNQLKMTVQCKAEPEYRDYLLLEQKAYQAYRLVTDRSFRLRPLSVTYIDSGKAIAPFTQAAFLVEDVGQAAARLGMRPVRLPHLDREALDPVQTNLLEVFQLMIGNTDWSVLEPSDGEDECCHNGIPLEPQDAASGIVVLPFDFDHAGLVDAPYAVVNPLIDKRSVRQRVYRGLCAHKEHVPGSLKRLEELRPGIESLFEDQRLGRHAAGKAIDYLRGFYAIAASETRIKRVFYRDCR